VHFKAVRKQLVVIILDILSTMFYVFEDINWRWCRHNTVCSYGVYTVNDGVIQSRKGGGAEPARPVSKSANNFRQV